MRYYNQTANLTYDLPYNQTNDSKVCIGGKNDGMSYGTWLVINFLSHHSCKYYHSWVISLGAAAIICPYGSLLKFLATCQCIQGRSFYQKNCIGRGIKQCFEYIGNKMLVLFSGNFTSILLFSSSFIFIFDDSNNLTSGEFCPLLSCFVLCIYCHENV